MLFVEAQALFVKSYLKCYPRDRQIQKYLDLKGREWLAPALEKVESQLFGGMSHLINPPLPEEVVLLPIENLVPASGLTGQTLYLQYACKVRNPLECDLAKSSNNSEDSALSVAVIQSLDQVRCNRCEFPASLPEKTQIRGKNGIYSIDKFLGRRGGGRLYSGIQQDTKQPIVIKEYVLPSRYFNSEEQIARQTMIKNLAGLTLVGSPSQDFRILSPIEVLSDGKNERCYLVLDGRSASLPLSQILQQSGALPVDIVHRLLNQILQILEVLHGQKFQLPLGQVQSGLTHGNLNLDTVLVQPDNPSKAIDATTLTPSNFFVYLSDLTLWEEISKTSLSKAGESSIAQDLINVGYIGFFALQGGAIGLGRKALDPALPEHWAPNTLALKSVIWRLLGLDFPFESAAAARQALLAIPVEAPIQAPDVQEIEIAGRSKWWVRLALVGVTALVVGLGLMELEKKFKKPIVAANDTPVLAKMKDVGAIPVGEFRYTAVQDGTWQYLLQTADLIESGQTLEKKIKASQPQFALKFEPSASWEVALADIRSGKVAFAIAPVGQPLPEDLEAHPIAYDALAVFVSFSYPQREQGLPKALKGDISLEQLQGIYRGEVNNWKMLTKSNLPVKPYQSNDTELSALFEQRIFSGSDSSLKSVPKSANFFELLRSVLRDFESNQTGSIGFAPFSRVFGQCSVYPLAIQAPGQNAIQPVVMKNVPEPVKNDANKKPDPNAKKTPMPNLTVKERDPIDPSTNLCDRKGSYELNANAFRSNQYPLAYPIAVIYPRRNDRPLVGLKFAEMMRTKEGQELLKQTGLVPMIGD
jgi:serine/threonine protein kinase